GLYALGQVVGKIFLFLPAAVSLVMFPRTSGISAKNMSALPTLKKSLAYVSILCCSAFLFYNIFPDFVMKTLTGKIYPDSIMLGRLFGFSMSFFALLFLLITYFLSIKDFRFIKYLVIFTALQVLALFILHGNILQVQLVLCVNAVLLFVIHLILAFKYERH
ncbi:MAG: hypothetical protein KJ818_02025, partial [Candidatus Omnitrophica bacterium]|nr:hypothetical protein [Candidatus Omnitrophota bacterium]